MPCVDLGVAEELGLRPPSGADLYSIEEASSISSAYLLERAVELELLNEEGDVISRVTADLVVQEELIEPLITDITIDELGIQVISFSKGLWRHVSDPPSTVRESAHE